MNARLITLLLLVSTACAGPRTFSGTVDMRRIDRGDIYIDTIRLPGGRAMMRAVAAYEAPPWRMINLYEDVESYPLWYQYLSAVRVTSREPGVIRGDVSFKPFWGRELNPTVETVRVDRARGEVAMTASENDWIRDFRMVVKVEPLGDGSRTLVTGYSQFEVKAWWVDVAVWSNEHALAKAIENMRSGVLLPRYAEQPPAAPAPPRKRVVVPGFKPEGVPEELARTLTRVFAQQLMRNPAWSVITQDEAVALLDHAKKQELIGCQETGCTLDIGRALAAERIVHGTVGKIGSVFVVSAALLKLPEGLAERRVTEEAVGDEALLQRVRVAASQLSETP